MFEFFFLACHQDNIWSDPFQYSPERFIFMFNKSDINNFANGNSINVTIREFEKLLRTL